MSNYQLTWITNDLAVGYAPMSYVDLDVIKAQGIDAIVNLCAEFCDLHEIEEKSGFEVYYFPIPDESAPDMEDMEKALEWLDEAIYLAKKVLVHCRYGIGRTGTFVTSYLLRRGLGLKVASKKMKKTRANPTTYCQWRLLRKYGKKSGVLTIREPSLESRNVVDLSTYFDEYEALVEKTEEEANRAGNISGGIQDCGQGKDPCCFQYFDLQLIEVIYLNDIINRTLKSELRTEIIHKAVDVSKRIKAIRNRLDEEGDDTCVDKRALIEAYDKERILCPLSAGLRCTVYENRPLRCKLYGLSPDRIDLNQVSEILFGISQKVFAEFSGFFLEDQTPSFTVADTVSGKFVQEYFSYIASLTNT